MFYDVSFQTGTVSAKSKSFTNYSKVDSSLKKPLQRIEIKLFRANSKWFCSSRSYLVWNPILWSFYLEFLVEIHLCLVDYINLKNYKLDIFSKSIFLEIKINQGVYISWFKKCVFTFDSKSTLSALNHWDVVVTEDYNTHHLH